MGEFDHYKLDDETALRIFHDEIVPVVFAHAQRDYTQRAFIFGGQPGAGKAGLVARTVRENPSITVIEGDQFRGYHPSIARIRREHGKTATNYTAADAGRWTEMAIGFGILHRYSLAIEGTMRNADTVDKTVKKLREAGYDVEARVMAVSTLESWQGVYTRYERQTAAKPGAARYTPREAHDAGCAGIGHNLQLIERKDHVNRLTLYTRDGDAIYDRYKGSEKQGAYKALTEFQNRVFSTREAQRHDERWAVVQQMMAGRGASEAERLKAATWREHDQMELQTRRAIAIVSKDRGVIKKEEQKQRLDEALRIENLPNTQALERSDQRRLIRLESRILDRGEYLDYVDH